MRCKSTRLGRNKDCDISNSEMGQRRVEKADG